MERTNVAAKMNGMMPVVVKLINDEAVGALRRMQMNCRRSSISLRIT